MSNALPTLVAERFRIQSLVGLGTVGRVYRAVQEPLDRLVALKVLNPELADEPAARRRFFREARVAARLNHPNVIQVYDFGETDEGQLYLAMEWVSGGSMAQWRSNPPDLPVLLRAFDELLLGLAAAHGRGVLHRALKPDNLLLQGSPSEPDRVVISDLGMASVFDASKGTSSGDAIVGEPRYMAPEQVAHDRPASPETDLYAAGVILYELLGGSPPFRGDADVVRQQHLTADVPSLVPRSGVSLPDGVRRCVERALKKAPEHRYRSAADMRSDLKEAITGGIPDRESIDERRVTLLGRDGELKKLRNTAISTLRGPSTQMVLVEGDSGVGKSMLANALANDLVQTGLMSLVRARCDDERLGNAGIAAAVEEVLGIRGCSREQARQRLETRTDLDTLLGGADLDDVLDDLRPSIADSLIIDLDALVHGRASRFALCLRAPARNRALAIVIEDLQRAPMEDVEVLQHLVALDVGDPLPVLVVACLDASSWRPDDARAQLVDQLRQAHAGVSSLQVGPLPRDACRELLTQRVGAGPVFARAVVDEVGSNPRVALAVADMAIASGHTEDKDGVQELLDPEALAGQVPDDVRTLIRGKIDRTIHSLPDGMVALRALVSAAVYGERFHPGHVADLCVRAELIEESEAVHRAFEQLVGAGLLEYRGQEAVDRMAFATPLLRHEVLNLLRATTRRTLHREAAALLKERGEGNRMHVVKAIARHLFAADEPEEGRVYLHRAAELAEQAWQLDEASSLYTELLDGIGEVAEGDLAVARARLALGRIHVRQGHDERAREMLVGLPEWASTRIAAESALLLAELALTAGNTSEATAWLQLARDRMPEDGRHAAWFRGEWFLLQERLLRARGDLKKRLEHLRQAILRVPEGVHRFRARERLAMALARGGRMEEGEEMLDDLEQSMPADLPPRMKVELVLDRAIVADISGDSVTARKLYRKVLARARQAGDPEHISQGLVGLAEINRAHDELDKAERQYSDALEIQRRMGHQRFIAITQVNLCMVALARGDLDAADRYLDEVRDLGADVSHPEVAVVYAFSRALVAGRRGDLDEARSELYRFQAVNSRVKLHEPDIANALEELGGLFRDDGDDMFGDELTHHAVVMWQQLGREDLAEGVRMRAGGDGDGGAVV